MNILVTGACGYKGTVLVPKLLEAGHKVRAIDTMWFGNFLPEHENLVCIKGDIIRTEDVDITGVDAIIHLASIANDPTGDLNPKLTWETSCLATMRLADLAARQGIQRFIYASSGSVYGVQEAQDVTEDLPLLPLSEYNKTKMVSERVLLSYSDRMAVQIVRPATVCGISARMRLDVSVNLLTMAALSKGEITVFGGEQTRPNIHIEDVTNLYLFLLDNPDVTGIFNAGFENLSIMDIANMIAAKLDVPIKVTASDDPRSYRVNSDKILKAGFKPRYKVADAIDQIITAYRDGNLNDEPHFHNLRWMEMNDTATAQI
jgi:nucleoside-diphosphate-sugar epimerase